MSKSWFYQLQNIDPVQVGQIQAAVKVIDYSRDGTADGIFSINDVATMRGVGIPWPVELTILGKSIPCVLSYISIGEAETYRSYWRPEWLKDSRPLWLSDENPDWAGNYKVEFWNGDWKRIVFDYLDDIIDTGFDGAYLDIIDAYEYWEDQGIHDAGNRMIRFVREIAAYCRQRNPFFWIVPQNGEGLLIDRAYREAIDGIAKEDLFYGVSGDKFPNKPLEISDAIDNLNHMLAAGKPVFTVEYGDGDAFGEQVRREHTKLGYRPILATRALDRPSTILETR